ncbi:MAG TPA: PIN domain-containing protein [Longimicrobium sp.]|nr:PIN domain-containing protein [Longimicrobium sp.]
MAIERRYWDSACFIAILQKEAQRVGVCAPILRAAELHALEIVTSTLTIAEVLYPQGKTKLDASLRQEVKRFLLRPGIVLVDLNRTVAQDAQEQVWDRNVRPKDAIHIASALYAGVEIFETYDEKVLRHSGKVGGTPPLIIREPEPWPAKVARRTAPQGDLLLGDAE